MNEKKHCASCSYFEMDLSRPRWKKYVCSLHKQFIVEDQAEKCADYWKIFTPKPERKEVER